HDVLRTRFSFCEGLPAPQVLDDFMITIPKVDLQKFDVNRQVAEACRLAEKEVLQPFDLTQAPLIRLRLYILSNGKHLLLITVHHAIADGWSLGVFLNELVLLYQKITLGKSRQAPELPIQYADYAHWQMDEKQQYFRPSSIAYWKQQLGGEYPI